MSLYLALLAAGGMFGVIYTPIVRTLATRLGLVDAPGGRKVHPNPVPRIGGLAVAAAAVSALVLVHGATTSSTDSTPLSAVLAGAALVLGIGVLDDLRPLGAIVKLAVQGLAAALVVGSGSIIERATIAGETWQLGVLAYPVTLAWIVALTNAFNLIDGVDGLAAGIAAIAGTACAVILLARGHTAEAALLTALVGASLGFLLFNFPPATIFLGDGGSLLLGFVLACTAITGWQKGATALATAVPLLLFALPIADSASALVRRGTKRGANTLPTPARLLRQLATPDREHIHHRLMALGWSARKTTLVLYAVTIVLSLAAVLTAQLE